MKPVEAVMSWPIVYKLWMAPQARKKFAPILAHNDLRRAQRVLDVGCGPGTNTPYFANAEYLGIDWNERYIEDARRRHNRSFLVADVNTYAAPAEERFDFILLNSLLHHIDTPATRRLLSRLSSLLTEDGCVHIVELVLPERFSVARWVARADRGKFPRPIEEWRRIFLERFEEAAFEAFDVAFCGAVLWNLVYFKGRARQGASR